MAFNAVGESKQIDRGGKTDDALDSLASRPSSCKALDRVRINFGEDDITLMDSGLRRLDPADMGPGRHPPGEGEAEEGMSTCGAGFTGGGVVSSGAASS